VVAELGPDHAKVFEVELDLRGEVVARAQGTSKKDAEQAAAKLGLDALAAREGEADGEAGAGSPTGAEAAGSFPCRAATPPLASRA